MYNEIFPDQSQGGGTLHPEIFRSFKVCYPKKSLYLALRYSCPLYTMLAPCPTCIGRSIAGTGTAAGADAEAVAGTGTGIGTPC